MKTFSKEPAMKRIILIVEQMTAWAEFASYLHGGALIKSEKLNGLQQAVKRGALLVEQMESRVSRTGTGAWYYTKWKVSFPHKLIPALRAGEFDGLVTTAPIPL